jgi:hypothetical protein
MTEPALTVGFTAQVLATDGPVVVGDVLVYNTSIGLWKVATSANRAAAGTRAQAVATTAYGGSIVGYVQFQMTGTLAAELVPDLGAGSESWVRVSATGRLERCTPAPGDDLAGKVLTNGRVQLQFGTWDSDNYDGGGGGGGGLTPAGNDGDVQVKNGTALAAVALGATGSVHRTTGAGTSAFGPLDLASANARTGVLPTANGGTGLSAAGSDGNVLTASGGVWTSAAPSGGATPGGSDNQGQYNNGGVFGGMSGLVYDESTNRPQFTTGWYYGTGANRVLFASSPTAARSVTFQDATGTVVLRDTADLLTSKTVVLANNDVTDTIAGNGDTIMHDGTRFRRQAKGSANQFYRMDGSGTAPAWTSVTILALAGSSGSVQYNNGSGNLAGSNVGSNGQFLGVVSSVPTFTNNANFYAAFSNAAASGLLRSANATDAVVGRNAANNADIPLLSIDNANGVRLGLDNAGTGQAANCRINGVNFIYQTINNSNYLILQSSYVAALQELHVGVTIGGSVDFTNPFRFKQASVAVPGIGGSFTLTAAQYACPYLIFTGSPSTSADAVLPTATGAYFIANNRLSNAQTFRVLDSGGAGLTIAQNKSRQVIHDGTDYAFVEIP